MKKRMEKLKKRKGKPNKKHIYLIKKILFKNFALFYPCILSGELILYAPPCYCWREAPECHSDLKLRFCAFFILCNAKKLRRICNMKYQCLNSS